MSGSRREMDAFCVPGLAFALWLHAARAPHTPPLLCQTPAVTLDKKVIFRFTGEASCNAQWPNRIADLKARNMRC